MTRRVEWTRGSLKALARLDRKLQQRIVDAVQAFTQRGAGDVRRYIEGEKGELAIRVGEWRVFVMVDQTASIVRVNDVRPRGSAYR